MHGRCGGTTIRTAHTRNAQQRGVTLEEASEVVHEGLRHEVREALFFAAEAVRERTLPLAAGE